MSDRRSRRWLPAALWGEPGDPYRDLPGYSVEVISDLLGTFFKITR